MTNNTIQVSRAVRHAFLDGVDTQPKVVCVSGETRMGVDGLGRRLRGTGLCSEDNTDGPLKDTLLGVPLPTVSALCKLRGCADDVAVRLALLRDELELEILDTALRVRD